MSETFLFNRLDSLERRFREVDTLLDLAHLNIQREELYTTYCRAAHILLVAPFEGAIKDVCKDIIDDLNYNCTYDKVPSKVFATFAEHFLIKERSEYSEKQIHALRIKLQITLSSSPANLIVSPFLFPINKNLAPGILDTILERFGIDRFFWSLKNSDLDVVFEDSKTETETLRDKLKQHLNQTVRHFPYTSNRNIYNPDPEIQKSKKVKTLWEEFIDEILKERHSIVHGSELLNLSDHEDLYTARVKIEILIYVVLINLCIAVKPMRLAAISIEE